MRAAVIERETFETSIKCQINIDGTGENNISTGIGFFDHMLTHISKHGFMDITLKAKGDIEVDCHHTVEDVLRLTAIILLKMWELYWVRHFKRL